MRDESVNDFHSMAILKFLFICLEVLVLFNVLIFVHELGHFWAARWRGLKAERFAIWFGKPIWKKTINGVEYVLGCIPFGGYVALPQMAPMDMIEGKAGDPPHEPLPPVSALDKIIVAFAGPLFSFLLAIVFALVVWGIGRPVNESETTTTVGYVIKGGPADRAKLAPGDKILEVDGQAVTKFMGMGNSIMWRVVGSEREKIPIKFERNGQVQTVEVTPIRPETKFWQRRALKQIQMAPAQIPVVGRLAPNSPAAAAGLKPFDQILEANGRKLYHPDQLVDLVNEVGTAPIQLKVRREEQGQEKDLQFTVQAEKPLTPPNERPRLGIVYGEGAKIALAYPHPVEQISSALTMMINTFTALVSSKTDIGVQHLSGAVKIWNIYYILFDSEQGWRHALWFSVVMNVNLALLNLLPLPVLDGGHILLAIVEGIRKRPVSLKILQAVQTACATLLIGFMLFVTFFDVQDLFGRKEKARDLQFAPKSAPAAPHN